MTQSSLNPFEVIEERLIKIENILNDLKKNHDPIPPTELVEDIGDISLAVKVTTLAKPTIYALVAKNNLPYMKQGKKLYFSRLELIDWIKTGKSKYNRNKNSANKLLIRKH